YVVGVQTSGQHKGCSVAALPAWPEGVDDQTTAAGYVASQLAYQYNSKVERLATSWSVFPSIKVVGGNTISGPFNWAAVSDRYFAAVFLPDDPQNAALVTLRSPIEIPHSPSDPSDKRTDKVDVF